VLPTHESFDREHRVLGIRDRLPACHLANESLSVLRKGDDGWCRPSTLGIGDHDGLTALHDRDHRIRGSEVDPDDFTPVFLSVLLMESKSTEAREVQSLCLGIRRNTRQVGGVSQEYCQSGSHEALQGR
jgi:hypothetical protein